MTMQEVHRWRGTPEQRAVREKVRKFGQFAADHRARDFVDVGLRGLETGDHLAQPAAIALSMSPFMTKAVSATMMI